MIFHELEVYNHFDQESVTTVFPSKKALKEEVVRVISKDDSKVLEARYVRMEISVDKENICRIIEGSGFATTYETIFDGNILDLIKEL